MRLINPNLERNTVPIIRFVLACLAASCILIPPHSAIIHHPAPPGHSPPDNHDNNSLSCKPPIARILKYQVGASAIATISAKQLIKNKV